MLLPSGDPVVDVANFVKVCERFRESHRGTLCALNAIQGFYVRVVHCSHSILADALERSAVGFVLGRVMLVPP